jgi:outer membrane protein assembly factor BamA
MHLAAIVIWVLLTNSAAGQASPQRSASAERGGLTLVEVHVSGSKRFPESDAIAEVGLKPGATVSAEDLKTGAERLTATGAFKNVQYNYSFSSRGMKAEFTVADVDRFVPVRFDNFVWLTPKQLADKLHEQVPLFNGELPEAGGLADDVSAALRTILVQSGTQGTISYHPTRDAEDRTSEFVYTVEGVRIDVRSVHFPGAAAEVAPLLEANAKPLVGTFYSARAIATAVKRDLLPLFRERGWLRASFAAPVPHVTQTAPDVADVDVDVPVEPGLQYRLKEFTFTGFKVLDAQQARKLMHVAPGQIANEIQFNKDLATVKDFYDSHGYIKAKISALPDFNDSAATVVVALQVNEGNQYRMGTFEVEGVEKSAAARLIEAWKLRAGEPYDKTYLQRYLASAGSVFPRLDQMKIDIDQATDESTQTVDVSLHFRPK